MSNKELVETARQAMKDLSAGNNMIEREQTAYNCLRLFCERIEQTNGIANLIKSIGDAATENINGWQTLDESDWGDQTGVLLTNRMALNIAKFIPLYHD